MIAPSEKHLEDWIVANPEKVLPTYWGYEYPGFPLIDRVLRRQPQFPNGRPDLIFEARFAVCVLELKKSVIDSDTVTQCYRYLHDLQRIAYLKYLQATSCDGNEPPQIGCQIIGFVMGHSIESDNLRIACRAMHITPLLYDFDGTGYTFRSASITLTSDDADWDWATGAIGDAVWASIERERTYEPADNWPRMSGGGL